MFRCLRVGVTKYCVAIFCYGVQANVESCNAASAILSTMLSPKFSNYVSIKYGRENSFRVLSLTVFGASLVARQWLIYSGKLGVANYFGADCLMLFLRY